MGASGSPCFAARFTRACIQGPFAAYNPPEQEARCSRVRTIPFRRHSSQRYLQDFCRLSLCCDRNQHLDIMPLIALGELPWELPQLPFTDENCSVDAETVMTPRHAIGRLNKSPPRAPKKPRASDLLFQTHVYRAITVNLEKNEKN